MFFNHKEIRNPPPFCGYYLLFASNFRKKRETSATITKHMTKQNEENIDYSGLEELLNTEVMKNYNSYIVGMAMKYAKNPKKVVDFGAGIGTLSLILRESFSIEPICIEIDNQNRQYLEKRSFSLFDELSSCGEDVDLIFSSNVLEHIEDDISVLRDMSQQLKTTGKIFLYLPAKMLLWSELDEKVGHYRRYEYTELKDKCYQVGLRIDAIHFADSVGFFASLGHLFLILSLLPNLYALTHSLN